MPNGGRMLSRFATDLPQWMQSVPGASWVPAAPEGTLGPHNRWICGQLALEHQCDYLWLIDVDMAIPPDALPRLLAHDLDIVGAAYHYRSLPLRTVVKMRNTRGELYIPTEIPKTLFSCASIGSGCTLIKVEALMRIPQPWFALEWDKDGCLIKTDDVWFCEQAASVGIKTYCDPTLEIRHIGDFAY
ncbi:MAG: hypothetical protein ACREXT_00665 [Gammaproteobacteria bacterium]